ncbi:MAG TPA: hypothetical protein VL200_12925 [Lacunisphaera sp.]|jgi:hypothetical protein|nr:hypothetical protein [Lacunisphaera sp.]
MSAQVYFVLGTPGSGRRAALRDLVENGLEPATPVRVFVADGEPADPSDAALGRLANVTLERWAWTPDGIPARELPSGATVFLMADSRVSPIDQLEALKPWLAGQGAELARVFCFVDCRLAEREPSLRQWFAACIHFSDVVFLTNRTGVANKWISDFVKQFTDECYPCHFIQVKAKGDLPNPALLLDPTPRRVSQYFDEGEAIGEIEGLETDDDEDADETGLLPEETYFTRDRSGRRARELPDIAKFLPPAA